MTTESTIPTPATPDVCTVIVMIEGTELSAEFHILSATVTNELNRIPTAMLQIRDGEASQSTFPASNTDLFIPGKHIEIKLGYHAKTDSVFKGLIVKHSVKVRKNSSYLLVECRDEAVRMTSGRKSRYFVDRKDSDIIDDLLGFYSLQNDIEATQPALKEVVQYDATDWDFLLCRAEANGYIVAVEAGKVTVGPPDTTQEPVVGIRYGATLLELDAEIDARWQSKGITAQSWSAADQEVQEAEATEPATTGNGDLTTDVLADVIGGDPHQLRHGGALRQDELQAWADARLLKERLAKVRGRARIQGFAAVTPGKVVEVSGIGKRFEGKVLVSGVRQTVSSGNWETDVQFGLNPEPIAETYRLEASAAAGLLPSAWGLQVGVVTALENDPDGQDRIKVRLPIIDREDEGSWARIATLDAGDSRGTFFRPEIGDEVVVGFLNADPRWPVVLGMCHSSAKPAPEPAQDTNHHKGYVSREKMKFAFDDEKKSVLLETPGGNKMTLSEEDKGIMIVDQNGNKITLSDEGIKIESAKDLTLKAANNIKLEGVNLDMKAQTGFKAAGSLSAELSSASTTVKGDTSTTISGGVVRIN